MKPSHLDLPPRSVYLPFMSGWRLSMGLQPLDLRNWIEIDRDLPDQLQLKRSLLADRHGEVFVSLAESQVAQQEVLDLLVVHLCTHFPQYYRSNSQFIYNLITNEVWDRADFVANPLDLAGRLVQEDLCLLLPQANQYHLMAASVCFPSRWSLPEKLGQPLAMIHHPVPGYGERLQHSVDQMFDRLRSAYPTVRFNWSIVDSPDLFLPPSVYTTTPVPNITATNAGHQLWLRVERQTLRRLPMTGAILFTIRTYIDPLDTVVQDPQVAQCLAEAVQQIPMETQRYKNMMAIRSPLLNYLGDFQEIKYL